MHIYCTNKNSIGAPILENIEMKTDHISYLKLLKKNNFDVFLLLILKK